MGNWRGGVSVMIRKLAVALFIVCLSSVSVAQEVPELNIVPGDVDENLSAFNSHELEFTFANQDSSQAIHNVTVDNTSYLEWNEYGFDLEAGESRNVNASFYTENITEFNDTLQSRYGYNETDNRFDGPNISFQASTFYEETELSLSTFETDFELEFDEVGESVFRISNTGNETAFNVSLEAEDVEFDTEDGFDIPVDDDILVEFDVVIPTPDVDDPTDSTNQTYSRDIEVTGENFNDTGFEASVFVPFNQFDREAAEEAFIDRFIEFCSDPDNSDSVICSDEQIVRYENQTETVYRTPEANVTLTDEEVLSLKELSTTTTEKYNDILHRVRLQQNTFRSELNSTRSNFSSGLESVEESTEANTAMIRSLNQTIVESNEAQLQEAENRSFWMMLIFVVVLLYVLVRGVLWLYKNWDDLTEDSMW